MFPGPFGTRTLATKGAAVFAATLYFAAAVHAQQSGPFTAWAGAWTGAGRLALSAGANERIRCRAKYDVEGSGLKAKLELRCASDSYKFELQSDVIYKGGQVQGDWIETTRKVSGKVEGTVHANQIDVSVQSASFSALLSLTTSGDKQSISIQAPAGSEMSQASIILNRGT